MSPFFDDFRAIERAVKQRLMAPDADELPADGTGGPRPFDIEPLEKWLYEGYARHYKNDPTLESAFWVGMAQALENSATLIHAWQGLCIQRAADLLDQIALQFGVTAIDKKPFAQLNKILGAPYGKAKDGDPSDVLGLQSALLRVTLLTNHKAISSSVLQAEQQLWRSLTLSLYLSESAQDVNALLVADTLCTLFRAWAMLGRREVGPLSMVRNWCQTGLLDKQRLGRDMKRTWKVMEHSKVQYSKPVWKALETNVHGNPSVSDVKLGDQEVVPRYQPSSPAVEYQPSDQTLLMV